MDSEQLRAAKAGDQAALDHVFDWVTKELLLLFQRRGTGEAAPDLAQQTSIVLLGKLDEAPEQPAVFGRWARAHGRKIELRWRRKVGRYSEILAEYGNWPHSPAMRNLESALGDQQARALGEAAIERLPTPYRVTLLLRRDGCKNHEIAAALGIAEPTVRWRLMVARQKLERLLEAAQTGETVLKPVDIAS